MKSATLYLNGFSMIILFRPAYQEYAPNTMYSSVGGAYYQTAGSQVRDITITLYCLFKCCFNMR